MPAEKTFEEISKGDRAQFTTVITADLVDAFAALSGDVNPLHTDEAYAAGTPFEQRVAHGMLAGAFFSRLVGMQLPGKHCLYLSQSLQFKRPMLIGMSIVVSGEVTDKRGSFQILHMLMEVRAAESQELLVVGEAIVQMI